MKERGFTLIELLVVLVIGLVLLSTAAINLKSLNNPLLNASAQMQSFLKKTRAKAISSTQAYRIAPVSGSQIVTFQGTNCGNATTADNELILDLPTGAQLADTEWEICFNTRGLLDSNLVVTLQDQDGTNRSIELMLGGSVREL